VPLVVPLWDHCCAYALNALFIPYLCICYAFRFRSMRYHTTSWGHVSVYHVVCHA